MNVIEWKDIAIVLLAILGYLLKDKVKSIEAAYKEAYDEMKNKNKLTDDDLKKFKSQYYVKMELREKESVEKFEKVYREISESKADIMQKMNEDKLEVVKKIGELSMQLKNK